MHERYREDQEVSPAEVTARAILDSAEAVFAEEGYAGAKTRAIVERAGVTLGLLHYHFGSKEQLYLAAFRRRAGQINGRRLAMLEAAGLDPCIEQVVDSFLRPAVEVSRKALGFAGGTRHYGSMLANVAAGGDERSRMLTAEAFDPIARKYIAAFQRALPGMSKRLATRGYLHAVAISIALMSETGRGRDLSSQDSFSTDAEEIIRHATTFICMGLRALAAEQDVEKDVEKYTDTDEEEQE